MVLDSVVTVLKNLFSSSATLKYPYVKRTLPPKIRGQIKWDMKKCDFCQDCMRVCPSFAIEVKPEEKVVIYMPYRCIFCHRCVDACMPEAITTINAPAELIHEKKDVLNKPE
jgi:formate hydrogenlyase subunit 6/NADH:ubiquinone oxidoreductase subunit I